MIAVEIENAFKRETMGHIYLVGRKRAFVSFDFLLSRD